MIYVTSDIHGKTDEFHELLHLADFCAEDKLYILGDVIDRNGDGGVQLLRWIMNQDNIEMLLGNHEAMMLKCGFAFSEEIHPIDWPVSYHRKFDNWILNGGDVTVKALCSLKDEVVIEIYRFLWELPAYKEITVDDMKYVLVHGGLENFSPERPLSDYTQRELVWYRPAKTEKYYDDRIVICGHTPTDFYDSPQRMFVGDGWIDIDTGAASAEGHPMLLRLDGQSLQPFYY